MTLGELLLVLAPGLPLMLALPWLRRLIPQADYVATLPAFLLLILPGNYQAQLPWLLFNTGFAVVDETRMLLLMALLLWVSAIWLLSSGQRHTEKLASEQYSTFYLLTLGGYLGAIVSSDLVGFFTFSTLMGYGFFALLANADDRLAKRAGRLYLCFMVAADLLLFEALLIAAYVTEQRGFESVGKAMADSSLAGVYVSMVLAGFALKAAIWPLHFWLPLAFRSARPAAALLLAGVPVAIGLLGMLRWLPLGEISLPVPGIIVMVLGGLALLYALQASLILRSSKRLCADITVFATGLFIIAVGAGLRDPVIWKEIANLLYIYIVFLGIGLALLSSLFNFLDVKKPTAEKTSDDRALWFERCSAIIIQRAHTFGAETLPDLRTAWLVKAWAALNIEACKKGLKMTELGLHQWLIAITLVLLVGISVVLVMVV